MEPKVSGRKIPFPRLLLPCTHRTRCRTVLFFKPRHSGGSDGMDQLVAGRPMSEGGSRSLRLRWRLESERAPLIWPGHGQVDETLQAKAARQASFDRRLDDLRREES